MRQKYIILRRDKENELRIKELANLDREYKINNQVTLDKEFFSLLCEETYEKKAMRSAIRQGRANLISTLRTQNLYPIGVYTEKIADSVISLYKSDKHHSIELLFDDRELLEQNVDSVEEV